MEPLSNIFTTYTKFCFSERRITTNTAIKLSSPARGSTPQVTLRSRPSRQAQVPEHDDLDADAEGEEDYEGEDAEEDSTSYCFCNNQGSGEVGV